MMKRFLDKIKILPNSCWEWQASIRNKDGYGNFFFNGKVVDAHRVSYELYIGEIPNRMSVCHSCDNTKCVSPFHLFLGTHADNMQDMISKNRNRKNYNRPVHPSLRHYKKGCRCAECKILKSEFNKKYRNDKKNIK